MLQLHGRVENERQLAHVNDYLSHRKLACPSPLCSSIGKIPVFDKNERQSRGHARDCKSLQSIQSHPPTRHLPTLPFLAIFFPTGLTQTLAASLASRDKKRNRSRKRRRKRGRLEPAASFLTASPSWPFSFMPRFLGGPFGLLSRTLSQGDSFSAKVDRSLRTDK